MKKLILQLWKSRKTEKKLLYIGVRKSICPYCGIQLPKFPLAKIKCKSCNQYIYSKTRPIDNKKILLKEDQLDLFEEQWAIKNNTYEEYLIKKECSSTKLVVSYPEKQNTKTDEIIITATKSGFKNKKYFLDAEGNPCSTEDIVYKYLLDNGYKVIRTEVSFWQAMFAFTFWDEIFTFTPQGGSDIPLDLFSGINFYFNRKQEIDSKYEQLLEGGIIDHIVGKIKAYKKYNYWTRLVADFERKAPNLLCANFVEFLKRIPTKSFLDIVYIIAQNPNANRSGVPDFVAWNKTELFHVEAKKNNEVIRASQQSWLSFFPTDNIKAKIIRVCDKK
jgi:hypothetical protein